MSLYYKRPISLPHINPCFFTSDTLNFFIASADNKTKGVAICFAKHINLSQPEIIADPAAHYLLLSGSIDGETYTFVSYYTPNKGQKHFFEPLLHKLQKHFKGLLFIGGDSNTAFDFSLDKSAGGKPKPKRPSKQSMKIAHMLHFAGLVDIWREVNPHMKDYTHFSAPHSSFTRIDHIFIHSTSIPLIRGSTIIDTPLSDHSIVTLIS